jgi:hypothetical protein
VRTPTLGDLRPIIFHFTFILINIFSILRVALCGMTIACLEFIKKMRNTAMTRQSSSRSKATMPTLLALSLLCGGLVSSCVSGTPDGDSAGSVDAQGWAFRGSPNNNANWVQVTVTPPSGAGISKVGGADRHGMKQTSPTTIRTMMKQGGRFIAAASYKVTSHEPQSTFATLQNDFCGHVPAVKCMKCSDV